MVLMLDVAELFLLGDHADEVSLHSPLESVLVLFRVDNRGHLTSVDDPLELSLKHFVQGVLLHEVDNTESHFLSLGIDNREQGVVHDVRFRKTQGIIINADLQDSVNRVTNGEWTA
jgi:hypothetical protein